MYDGLENYASLYRNMLNLRSEFENTSLALIRSSKATGKMVRINGGSNN